MVPEYPPRNPSDSETPKVLELSAVGVAVKERSAIQVTYDLNDVLEILRRGQNKKLYEPRRIKVSVIDHFLYSGRFNSVLGLDGFQIFKAKLKEVIARVNDDDFGPNLINLDKMFEALLDSGLYYVEKHLPPELAFLKADERWLTAYRYIARNFPEISYVEFRLIVNRFKDTMGHSFYVETGDSDLFKAIAENSKLFKIVVDIKAALMQMSMRQLRDICAKEGIAASRRLEETADRIVGKCGELALGYVPQECRSRRSLIIRDEELATGEDIIHLDTYLRAISKVVREDLIEFVNSRRQNQWSR